MLANWSQTFLHLIEHFLSVIVKIAINLVDFLNFTMRRCFLLPVHLILHNPQTTVCGSDKPFVVSYHHNTATEVFNAFSQSLDGFDVQVVGWFVLNQQIIVRFVCILWEKFRFIRLVLRKTTNMHKIILFCVIAKARNQKNGVGTRRLFTIVHEKKGGRPPPTPTF